MDAAALDDEACGMTVEDHVVVIPTEEVVEEVGHGLRCQAGVEQEVDVAFGGDEARGEF